MKRTKLNGNGKPKEIKRRKKPGRTGVYNDTYPMRAFKLCLLGLTNADLAIAFGVSVAGIETWLRTKPEFKRWVQKGKSEADSEVAHSLYQRAVGYEHEDIDIRAVNGEIVKTKFTKKYPPETNAAIFWLKNRTKRNVYSWADINRIEHTGEVHLQQAENIDLKEFTTDELKMIRDCGLKIQSMTHNGQNPSDN